MENGIGIKVLVAESVDLVRIGLRSLFQADSSIRLVAETNSMGNLPTLMAHYKPDIALIDIGLNSGDNYREIKSLLSNNPSSKILFLSQHSENGVLQKIYNVGVSGVVFKYYSCKLLLKAIHAIHAGQVWFDCHLNPGDSFRSSNVLSESVASQSMLSNRERHIARLACTGLSAKEIGNQLLLTEKTIRNQLSLIYRKIGVKKKIELCLKARSFNNFK
ncbi:MAG: response regulator transcription factor [Nitrosomonas sp.]|nr:response regulator transcription factor [Nitrosomonas sp.]